MSANPDHREEVVARAIYEETAKRYEFVFTWDQIGSYRRAWYLSDARAALKALDEHEGEGGFVRVPVEPTEEMLAAGRLARMNIEGGYGGPGPWEAMLAAAPRHDDGRAG
jgi:hypothetical protein